jgi:multiple sugar transport system substrate-binding protein
MNPTRPSRLMLASSVTAAVAAACLGLAPAADAANMAGQGQAAVTINLWQCGPGPGAGSCMGAGYPGLVSRFEASHPNIKIDTRYIPFANLDTVFDEAFAAGSGPDIADVNTSGDYGLFSSKGYLKNISGTIVGQPNVKPSDFYPNEWREVVLPQGTFGIPIDTGTRALYWNKTLFKEAGLAPFGTTVTWAQVLNAAQKISALGHGIYGFEYAGGEKWSMLYNNIGPLVFQAGGEFINKSATMAYATSAAVEKAVSYWDQLAKYGPASDITQQNQSIPVDAFAKNQAGMYYNGFWDIGSMLSVNPKVQFGETEMKDVSVDSNTGGWVLSVPSFTPSSKMKAIEEFYSYVFAPQNEIDLTGIMPAVKAATPLDKAIEGPQYQIFWNILKEHAQQPVPLTANMYQEGIDILNAVEATELGHSVSSEMRTLQSQLQSLLQ